MARAVMPVEERLLRAMIAVAPRRAALADAARGWFPAAEKQTLQATFARDGLVPLAGSRLLAVLGDDAPAWMTQWVDAHAAHARAEARAHEVVELMVLAALGEADIPVMTLKGTRLGRDVYGDPALRRSGDIDLLVPVERLHDGVAAVRAVGWSAPGDPVDRDGLPRLHFALPHPDGLPPVELHWRITHHDHAWSQGILARAQPAGAERVPSPGDLLALLLLFFARDGFNNLRLAADIAAWWDAYGDEPMCDALAAIDAEPHLRRALVTSAVAAERVAGLPSERVLGLSARSPDCSRLALRFATTPLAVTVEQRLAERRLIEPLLAGDGARRRAVRQLVFPSPQYVRYLQPNLAARRFGVPAGVAATATMVPVRAAITAGRLRGMRAATVWEQAVDARRSASRERLSRPPA